MDEKHQGKIGSRLGTTEDKLWLPPLSSKDQKKLMSIQKKPFPERIGLSGKSIWDWLQLLIVPVVLATGGYLFGTWQHNVDQQQALDQQRATILQTYLDNMQDLLLNHNLLKSSPYHPTNPYYDVAILARARTLAALQELDPERKGRLLIFLYEAKLIGSLEDNGIQDPIIDLSNADLSNADLSNVDFDGASLDKANLNNANFSNARLPWVQFHGAKLNNANLHGAILINAYFDRAYLIGTDLSDTALNNADLNGADLGGANLGGADLSEAQLGNAGLSGTDLRDAKLSETDLSETYYLTQQQLDQVSTCKSAILPKELICNRNV